MVIHTPLRGRNGLLQNGDHRGGVVRARAVFGARLPALLDELTDTLVA